jgi:hypothetical protein
VAAPAGEDLDIVSREILRDLSGPRHFKAADIVDLGAVLVVRVLVDTTAATPGCRHQVWETVASTFQRMGWGELELYYRGEVSGTLPDVPGWTTVSS